MERAQKKYKSHLLPFVAKVDFMLNGLHKYGHIKFTCCIWSMANVNCCYLWGVREFLFFFCFVNNECVHGLLFWEELVVLKRTGVLVGPEKDRVIHQCASLVFAGLQPSVDLLKLLPELFLTVIRMHIF